MKKQNVLVLGGHGFIGSAIAAELLRQGFRVIIGTRARHRYLKPGERRVVFHQIKKHEWPELIDGIDIVVNSVGILRERWSESYEQVHHYAVRDLANACAQAQIKLIHISALGLENPLKSRFLTSKRRGEQTLMASQADWHIVRPSLLDGHNGYGARWFRRIAGWPLHATPADAIGWIAPLHVNALANSVIDLIRDPRAPKILELAGDKKYRIHHYLRALRGKPPWINIFIPGVIVRAFSHLFDLLHITPLSFGHYELMKFDNLPNKKQQSQLTKPSMLPIKCH